MDINIKVEFPPEFYDSINALAVAIAGSMELILDGPGARANKAPAAVETAAPVEAEYTEAPGDKTESSTTTPTPTEPTVTLKQVRAKLSNLSQNGKQAQVKELINKYAKKLTEIPPEKFSEVMKAAGDL